MILSTIYNITNVVCVIISLICKIYKDYALFYISEHKTLTFAARLVLVCNLFT